MESAPNMESESLTLLIDCNDQSLVKDVEESFGGNNVSASSNFIGGVSIAVFLTSVKLLQPTIKTILDFLAQRSDRYEGAQIVFDGKRFDLKGYSPDEVEKILSNPIFAKARS